MLLKASEIQSGQRGLTLLLNRFVGGDRPLASTFPELFNCASNQEAKVIDYMERRGDCVSWGLVFRRNLNEVEKFQFRSLLNMIGEVFIPTDGKDRRIWMPTTDGNVLGCIFFFLFSFFCLSGEGVVVTHINWPSLWSIKPPPAPRQWLLGGRA